MSINLITQKIKKFSVAKVVLGILLDKNIKILYCNKNHIQIWGYYEKKSDLKKEFEVIYNYDPKLKTVLDKGIEFYPEKLTDSELEDIELLTDYASQMNCDFAQKECFHNAQIMIMAENILSSDLNNEIQYIEGYFVRDSLNFPVHHGWVSINGKVIDTTIRQDDIESEISGLEDRVFGLFPNDLTYIGIIIDKEDVLNRIEDSSETHTILDDWNIKYKHIKDKYLKN